MHELKILSYNVCYQLLSASSFMNHCKNESQKNICIPNIEKIILPNNQDIYDIIALQEISKFDYDNFSQEFKTNIESKYNIIFSHMPNSTIIKTNNLIISNIIFESQHHEIINSMLTFVKKEYSSELLRFGSFGRENHTPENYSRIYQIIKINNFIFINIHMPHINYTDLQSSYLYCFDTLNISLNAITPKFDDIIICGDFNADFYSNFNKSRQISETNNLFEQCFQNNKLGNFVIHKFDNIKEKSCCHQGNSDDKFEYLSDNIFSSMNFNSFMVIDISSYIQNDKYYISDHKPITANISYTPKQLQSVMDETKQIVSEASSTTKKVALIDEGNLAKFYKIKKLINQNYKKNKYEEYPIIINSLNKTYRIFFGRKGPNDKKGIIDRSSHWYFRNKENQTYYNCEITFGNFQNFIQFNIIGPGNFIYNIQENLEQQLPPRLPTASEQLLINEEKFKDIIKSINLKITKKELLDPIEQLLYINGYYETFTIILGCYNKGLITSWLTSNDNWYIKRPNLCNVIYYKNITFKEFNSYIRIYLGFINYNIELQQQAPISISSPKTNSVASTLPKDTPTAKSAPKDRTPKATPKATPKDISPKATPKATPKDTPKDTPPKATSYKNCLEYFDKNIDEILIDYVLISFKRDDSEQLHLISKNLECFKIINLSLNRNTIYLDKIIIEFLKKSFSISDEIYQKLLNDTLELSEKTIIINKLKKLIIPDLYFNSYIQLNRNLNVFLNRARENNKINVNSLLTLIISLKKKKINNFLY
uniref:Endonuclease/exonuclease/phosphatase domain-containing protein n=1 Tax=viral metagenome TaxID=1070528 RepID=A0A6C0ECV2_9ZZZZ